MESCTGIDLCPSDARSSQIYCRDCTPGIPLCWSQDFSDALLFLCLFLLLYFYVPPPSTDVPCGFYWSSTVLSPVLSKR